MTIEIHHPQLEALIQQRMASGLFGCVEEVLMAALQTSSDTEHFDRKNATGEALIAAMQSSPYKDIELEPSRPHLPVREVLL